jgi:hypothetical protein
MLATEVGDGAYPKIESLRVGKHRNGMQDIVLPKDIWLPRAQSWGRALHASEKMGLGCNRFYDTCDFRFVMADFNLVVAMLKLRKLAPASSRICIDCITRYMN